MERVGALLGSMEGGDPLRRRLAEARALETWPELVGPHLAKLTRPLHIAGGRLFVVAHGSSLRQELVFQRREILARINRAAGARVARELVLLESDANLSSLMTEERPATDPAAEGRPAEVRSADPIDDERADDDAADDERSDDERAAVEPVPESAAEAVPAFDAAGYRRALERIAEESKSPPGAVGSGGNRERK